MSIGVEDGLELSKTADRFIGPHLIDVLALGTPVPVTELEDRRGMIVTEQELERLRLELDEGQRQQMMSVPVSRPEDLVMPVGRLPPLGLGGLRSIER